MPKSRKAKSNPDALNPRESEIVTDALGRMKAPDFPLPPSDALRAAWQKDARKRNAVRPLPFSPASDEPLRFAARNGLRISQDTEDRLRHLVKHGERKPDGR